MVIEKKTMSVEISLNEIRPYLQEHDLINSINNGN